MNRKSVISLTLLLTIVCFQQAYAEVVNIPDANLEAVIREEIGKPEGDITDTDLQGITELDSQHDWDTPDGEKIVDLTGLEYCTNLQYLSLVFNQIIDISAIAGLNNLENLSLDLNQIIDISAVAGLNNLQELSLYTSFSLSCCEQHKTSRYRGSEPRYCDDRVLISLVFVTN